MVVARTDWWSGALVASLLVLGACSGDGDAFQTTTTSAPPFGSTTVVTTPVTSAPRATAVVAATTSTLPVDTGELGGLDAALTPEGTVDLDAALRLVAAGYAPIPGVTPADAPLVDGGPALRTVVASVAELPTERSEEHTSELQSPCN